MKKISFVYRTKGKVITGGHKYEKQLRDTLSAKWDVEVTPLFKSGKTTTFRKIIAPFLSIRLLKNVKDSNIIVFNSTSGLFFGILIALLRLMGKRTIVIHHHFLSQEFSGIKGVFYGWVEKMFMKLSTYVLTPSPYVKDLIIKDLGINPYLLPIPFTNDRVHDLNPIPGKLLYIGTVEPRKGLIYLLKGISNLNKDNNIHLHIVGKIVDSSYKNELERVIREHQLNVTFHGFLSDDEIDQLKATSDLFVFPSLLEGYGMVVNEVRFYGLPVLCFNNSALPYSVTNDKDGLLIENKNSEQFGLAITKVISDRTYRNKLGAESLVRSRNLFSERDFKNESAKIFQLLME